jgi:hypothetical protein
VSFVCVRCSGGCAGSCLMGAACRQLACRAYRLPRRQWARVVQRIRGKTAAGYRDERRCTNYTLGDETRERGQSYANEKDSLGRAPPLPSTFSCSSFAFRFSSRFLFLSASICFCFCSSSLNLHESARTASQRGCCRRRGASSRVRGERDRERERGRESKNGVFVSVKTLSRAQRRANSSVSLPCAVSARACSRATPSYIGGVVSPESSVCRYTRF